MAEGVRPQLSRRRGPRSWKGAFSGWVLIAPAFAFLTIVLVYPVLEIIRSSLTNQTRFSAGEFVGFDNFIRLADDPLFWQAFRNNMILLVSIPISVIAGLAVTSLLYRGVIGTRLFRALIFLPFVPSVAAVGVVFIYLLTLDGPVNGVLSNVGLDRFTRGWLTDSNWAIWSIMGVITWKRVSFAVLLFTARMLSIDKELFQAAAIDGANWRKTYLRVAIPQLKGIIEFFVILSFLEVFSWTFAYVFVLTQGGPFRSTYTLEYYLYQQQFLSGLPGMAAAVAVVLVAFATVLAVYRIRQTRMEFAQ